MRYILRLAALAALAAGAWAQTAINDTIVLMPGGNWTGTIGICWPAFTAASGTAVVKGCRDVTVTDGALSVSLFPTEGAAPSFTYAATYRTTLGASRGTSWRETWAVPSAPSTVTLAAVRQSSTLKIFASQILAGGISPGTYCLQVASEAVSGFVACSVPTKNSLGLGNVDNTADADKPVSTAQAAALAGKEPIDAKIVRKDASGNVTIGATVQASTVNSLLPSSFSSGAKWFVDPINGNNDNTGLSPLEPFRTLTRVSQYAATTDVVAWKLPNGLWIPAPPWSGITAQYDLTGLAGGVTSVPSLTGGVSLALGAGAAAPTPTASGLLFAGAQNASAAISNYSNWTVFAVGQNTSLTGYEALFGMDNWTLQFQLAQPMISFFGVNDLVLGTNTNAYNSWACSYDGTTLRGYRDGTEFTLTSAYTPSARNFKIGERVTAGNNWTGTISYVLVYNAVLDAAAVAKMHNFTRAYLALSGISLPVVPEAMVTFVFDDGNATNFTLAKPVFDAKNVPAVAAVVTDWIGTGGKFTGSQIQQLSAAGWEIASHSKTHPADWAVLSAPQTLSEFQDSKAAIQALGVSAHNFVWPFGSSTATATAKTDVALYYNSARGTGIGSNYSPPRDLYDLQGGYEIVDASVLATFKGYVDAALANKTWLVIFSHNTTATVATTIGDLIDYIKSKSIPIVTTNQALKRIGLALPY